MKQITNFTEFENEVNQRKKLLAYFTASWCGPCSSFSPVMDKTADAFDTILTSIKIDVDEVPEAAGALQVRSVPSLVLFEDGKPVEGQVGAQSYEQVSRWLSRHLLTL